MRCVHRLLKSLVPRVICAPDKNKKLYNYSAAAHDLVHGKFLFLLLFYFKYCFAVVVDGETFKKCGLFPMILTFNVSPFAISRGAFSFRNYWKINRLHKTGIYVNANGIL